MTRRCGPTSQHLLSSRNDVMSVQFKDREDIHIDESGYKPDPDPRLRFVDLIARREGVVSDLSGALSNQLESGWLATDLGYGGERQGETNHEHVPSLQKTNNGRHNKYNNDNSIPVDDQREGTDSTVVNGDGDVHIEGWYWQADAVSSFGKTINP